MASFFNLLGWGGGGLEMSCPKFWECKRRHTKQRIISILSSTSCIHSGLTHPPPLIKFYPPPTQYSPFMKF